MSGEILFGIPNKKATRHRVTKTGLVDRRAALLEIVRAAQPATVRQIFYLASVRGIVAKDEGGYSRVQIDLVDMRRSGQLPYGWIVDHTRWQRRPVTFDSIEEALADTASTYRKALWRDIKSYVEIWLEKDALSGVILPVTKKFDVPLMVARGYASETSFIRAASTWRPSRSHASSTTLAISIQAGRMRRGPLKKDYATTPPGLKSTSSGSP